MESKTSTGCFVRKTGHFGWELNGMVNFPEIPTEKCGQPFEVGTNQLEISEPFDGISWNLSVPVLSGFPQNTFHIQTDQSINGKLPFHLVCYGSGKVLIIMHRSPQPNLLNKWKAPIVNHLRDNFRKYHT